MPGCNTQRIDDSHIVRTIDLKKAFHRIAQTEHMLFGVHSDREKDPLCQ